MGSARGIDPAGQTGGTAQLRNDTVLRALRREPTPYTPLWVMRQAGRYLPEYNATRARAGSFLDLCRNPAYATEVTLQPLERFALDAAIVFSDILTIPDAMGLGLRFEEGAGPWFERPVRSVRDIDGLGLPDPARELRYVLDTVAQARRALAGRVPLIGFAGSPFTLACYMIEGKSGTDFTLVKRMLYEEPAALHRLLELNAAATAEYLQAQVEHGAQALMLFDTWGGILTTPDYHAFSLAYTREVLTRLRAKASSASTPCIVFTRGGGLWLEAVAACGCDALGLDWTIDIGEARRRVGNQVALQGNMDPCVLLGRPETVAAHAQRILQAYGHGPGHVFNLGHGIVRTTPPENVHALVESVHADSRPYHL